MYVGRYLGQRFPTGGTRTPGGTYARDPPGCGGTRKKLSNGGQKITKANFEF
jgi:hypothetical protein